MWSYVPPFEDMRYVLDELLDVPADWVQMPRFAELDREMSAQILDQAGKFAVETLAPKNGVGDRQGCRFDSGRVTTPDGFAAAYRAYCEGGWPALACDVECGGQGLPQVLNAALYEMLNAANHAWTMYPGLAHGAYECLRAFAPELIKRDFLPRIVSGAWLSTMCLTEPQAGSDVGLVRTLAEPRKDGLYVISGSKIFISGGEHDLTENIVHLVLARLPDAPIGTRGISLFLVPKLLPVGETLVPNYVRCDGIETKMGINGSATCVVTFDTATGWMIGEPNRGLAAMFVMMNSARLYVGLQGLGHAEMAYQNALRYASERVQMRAVKNPDNADRQLSLGADPILLQPSMRKVLLTLRAFVEGERALGYWAAHLLDVAEYHRDSIRRSRAHTLVSLLTPIIKSFFTDNGFTLSSAALQVWGGYGYINDYGIEQSVRDSRIAMIYEGTNEIQAIDLLVRKIISNGGQDFKALLDWVGEEATRCAAHPTCERFGALLGATQQAVSKATTELIADSALDSELGHRVAGDFMRLCGLLLLGTLWARAARLAVARLPERFYARKLETATFFFDYLMPEADLRIALVTQRGCPLPWIDNPSN